MTSITLIPNKEFFENYSEPLLIANASGELLLMNRAYTALTGGVETDTATFKLSELLHGKAPGAKKAGINLPKKDGTSISIMLATSSITLTNGTTGMVYVFTEAAPAGNASDEVEQLKKKLEKTTEELEQLAYVASHDLQEPLRTITSYIQLIQKNIEKGNLEAVAEFMKFVVEGAARMQGLITDLLQYSRISKKGSAFAPVDLNDVMKATLAQFAAKINDKGATVKVAELPKVNGDPIQLSRLFQNLLDNALKFSSPETKPEVEISVQDREKDYLFSIRDNGLGIEEKFYNRIFVIFQKLHARGEYEGTGLGLAVGKKIVERHGGEIWVESEKGKGSTFYFTLEKN